MWGSLLRRAMTTFLAVLVALWGVPAAADTVVADGDIATPFAAAPVSFGTVCLGETVAKPVPVGLQRSGLVSGGEVFANSTNVLFSLVSRTGNGFTTAPSLPPSPFPGFTGSPFAGLMTPADWSSRPDLTTSGPHGAFIVILTPTETGSVGGQVNISARGLNPAGTMITRPGSVSVTATVTNCQDTTPPVLSVPTSFDVEATSPAGAAVSFSASAAWNFPFQPDAGSHTSILISESLVGVSVAATRQNSGSLAKTGSGPDDPCVPGGTNAPGAICWAIVTFAFGNVSAAMDSQVADEATAVGHTMLIPTNAVRSVRRVMVFHGAEAPALKETTNYLQTKFAASSVLPLPL